MNRLIFTLLVGLFFAGALLAQTATPKITKKQINQQARINQGVRSGELTVHETKQLERQQAKIQMDKKIAKSDGVVTKAERTKIRREQVKASNNIFRKKHNKRVAK